MKQWRALCCALLLGAGILFVFAPLAYAGDEDEAAEAPKAAPIPMEIPAPTPPPAKEVEPDLSFGKEDKAEKSPTPPVRQQAAARAPSVPFDPDKNIDYSEANSSYDTAPLERGVLPLALGFRGYRPNMIAVAVGDRTPGVGAMLEYSWNRIGVGVAYSYRSVNALFQDRIVKSQSFGNIYGLYRWLPFEVSPYFLFGAEVASSANDSFGGIAGLGAEARIYYGWTILFGYTYHSVLRRGFIGGSLGWSF